MPDDLFRESNDPPDPHRKPSMNESDADFIYRTGRKFWLDPDGTNRWDIVEQNGEPLVEDLGAPVGECQACGHAIEFKFYVRHPTRGVSYVGSECINKVRMTFDLVPRARMDRALYKAKRMQERKALDKKIELLEAAASDPPVRVAYWDYLGRSRNLSESLRRYAQVLRDSRKRRPMFENALRAPLEKYGHPEVFPRRREKPLI